MAKKKKGPTPRKPPHLKMAVIPKPAPKSASVMEPGEDFPVGEPYIRYVNPRVYLDCGSCGYTLLALESVNQVQQMVFKCLGCGAYNTTID